MIGPWRGPPTEVRHAPLHTPPITLATGGSRGPGRNTALRIARGGGDVFITSRRQAAVADTAALRRRAVALRFDTGNITTFGAFTEHLRAVPQQTRQRAPASTIWSTPLAMVTGGAPKTSRQHGQAPRRRQAHVGAQRICTEPETVTTTCALPASTGTAASDNGAALASIATMRGRGPGDISLLCTATSRRL